jgi:hypothetical protein
VAIRFFGGPRRASDLRKDSERQVGMTTFGLRTEVRLERGHLRREGPDEFKCSTSARLNPPNYCQAGFRH